MAQYKNLLGNRYGMLVAIEHMGSDTSNNALWKCKCDCGNEKVVNAHSLRRGDTKSCGCLQKKNLQNKRFGRLLVIKEVGRNAHRNTLWECECDCGNVAIVDASSLISGHTISCGCYMRETSRNTRTTHGKSNERLYVVWQGMLNRCKNENHISYHNYGGRGVCVCNEWENYETFRQWALSNGYDENAKRGDCTLDRIDVNGNYEPQNCRWADMKTQCNNKRNILKAKE